MKETFESPVGQLTLVTRNDAVVALTFAARHPAETPDVHVPAFHREVQKQLEAYFRGSLRDFDLPLAPDGTDFQLAVWRILREIPYGCTTTYGEIARKLGDAAKTRAVGAANGRNPIAIITPCHRVIGADGSLTGFAGGLAVKRLLLDHEAAFSNRSPTQQDLFSAPHRALAMGV